MKNTIYICVPAYNAEKYINQCIHSVLMQDYQSYKMVIIDDGSKDHTGVICDEFMKKDNRVIVLHEKNEGLWAARQKAVDYIKSIETDIENSYLMFLDSDDTLKENALSVVAKYIQRSNVDMLIYGFDWVKENGKIIKTFTHDKKKSGIIRDKRKLYRIVYFDESYNSLCRKAIKLKLFFKETKHNYQPVYGEDLLRSIDFYTNCSSVNFIREILYNYTIVPSSITHNIKIDSFIKDFCYVKSHVYSILLGEPSMKQEDIISYYHILHQNINQIIWYIAASEKEKREKLRLFQIFKNDLFTKTVIENIESKDILLQLLKNDKFSVLIVAGKMSYFINKVKTKIQSSTK